MSTKTATIEDPGDLPGRELPKDYREVAVHLVRDRGWRYRRGVNHPVLYPANGSSPIPVPTSPSHHPRAFRNWVATVRRAGGDWPPKGAK